VSRLVVFAFALALCLLFCGSAAGYVYWSESSPGGSIGRASLAGTPEPGRNWIHPPAESCGITVDSGHVYWTSRSGEIGRANLDGSEVESNFIVLPGGWACGVAVDSEHIYWTYNSSGKLGRASLNGADVQPSWMSPGVGHGCGIAVNETTVFWTTDAGVYRAPLSGGPPTALTTATKDNCGIAINGVHAYWATGSGFIERDLLTGGPPTPIVSAPLGPCGVAVDTHSVYWGNARSDTLGRANLDGSGAEQRFAAGTDGACGVAVDQLGTAGGRGGGQPSGSLASNQFQFGRLRKNRVRGIARLEVILPGPGTVSLRGRRIVSRELVSRTHASPASPVSVQLLITPKPGTRRILKAVGKASAFFAVTFHPVGGLSRTRYNRIRLALDRQSGHRFKNSTPETMVQ
jgi:virginiamycin B lyase